MRNFQLLIISLLSSLALTAQVKFSVSEKTEKKIDKLLSKMTLAEKVGQTCQITLDVILERDSDNKVLEPAKIAQNKLKEAIGEYHVGSILNVSSHTLGLEEWKNILAEVNKPFLSGETEVPIIYGIDAIHGNNYTKLATLFPQEIGLAATWNRSLARQFGEVTAYEARASGLRWNFSPVLDVGRQPLWSRFFETLGEDPFLVAILGEEIVKGYQGENSELDCCHVAACLKHFVGYSVPISGRDRTPAWIPDKYMTEIYLPPFKRSVDAGAMTLMINSGDVNGIPGHNNKKLLTDVLKQEWGFQGFTVSDWEDFLMLESVHNVGTDTQDAIVKGFNAGVDMSMVPLAPFYKDYCKLLIKSVEEGKVSVARLDDAVRRILRVKYATGLFDKKSYEMTDYPMFGSKKFHDIAYESAAESITLLKNEKNILPLKKDSKILVAGPTANNLIFINGAWTHTWQGSDTAYNTPGMKTIYQAISDKVGPSNCQYSEGARLSYDNLWEQCKLVDTDDFKAKAANSDVIILCLGELPSTEKTGDIRSLRLLQAQLDLAKIAYSTGKKVVLVLTEARPRVINEIVPQAAAIIQAYLPGDFGGIALADIIFGDRNPNGKLPYTYPKYDGVFEHYDHPRSVDRSGKTYGFDAYDPQWDFGFGLSYTSYAYSNLTLDKNIISENESVKVKIDVKNTGEIAGKEVVQIYLSDNKASLVPAGKKLVCFDKVSLAPGESKTLEFIIDAESLRFSDSDGNWLTEKGDFTVTVEKLSKQFKLK